MHTVGSIVNLGTRFPLAFLNEQTKLVLVKTPCCMVILGIRNVIAKAPIQFFFSSQFPRSTQ